MSSTSYFMPPPDKRLLRRLRLRISIKNGMKFLLVLFMLWWGLLNIFVGFYTGFAPLFVGLILGRNFKRSKLVGDFTAMTTPSIIDSNFSKLKINDILVGHSLKEKNES